ncbi:MAG: glucose-6-phosphate dehydrogenase assembly protein OpcA [Alkalinema sp. CACIAM 70d]|nr:MAG: glucose-6-phosphate dehydrogenase assembly protein OpcA [Alkalinema sp. CACIAM 70d]
MTPTPSAPVVPLQAPKDVSLGQIQAELDAIWTTYEQPSADGSTLGAMKATTFTLVVYEPEETQQLLAELGYYTGPIDGIGGPRMDAAIRAAQQRYGFNVTGKISSALLDKLRREVAVCRGIDVQEGDTCNLSLYSRDSQGSGLADVIAAQNPCRIISLFPGNGSDEGVSAQVSAYCPIQKRASNTLVCCEYITLKGTEPALERVTGLVSSLVISELPSFLWWKGSPNLEQELFQSLAKSCTMLIVDSSRFMTDGEQDLARLQQLRHEGVQVADLNWRRLAPWQELTAEAFDAPERWQGLLEIDRVTIDYERGNPTQALMFLGWLASRLNWQPLTHSKEGGDYDIQRITFTNEMGKAIEAELAAIPTADPGVVVGDLLDLRLTSTNPDADCCTVLCSETTGCMRMESGGGAQSCWVNQVTSLGDEKAENLLSEQLRSTMRDLLYEDSLAIVAKIVNL